MIDENYGVVGILPPIGSTSEIDDPIHTASVGDRIEATNTEIRTATKSDDADPRRE